MDNQMTGGMYTCGAVCTNDAEVTVYPSLAMVYIPRQVFREIYDYDVALSRGTIFRELDKPFTMKRGMSGAGGTVRRNGSDYRR